MMDDKIPRPVTAQERWIAKHFVDTVHVENRQIGVDTAETYVHLTAGKEKVVWQASIFNQVAELNLGWNTCVCAKYGIREKVEAREKYEKNNSSELATYK